MYASLKIGSLLHINGFFFFFFLLSFCPYILHIYISSTILLISKSKVFRKKKVNPSRLCCYSGCPFRLGCNWITVYTINIVDSAFFRTITLMAKAYFMAFVSDIWPRPKGYFASAHTSLTYAYCFRWISLAAATHLRERHQDAKSC